MGVYTNMKTTAFLLTLLVSDVGSSVGLGRPRVRAGRHQTALRGRARCPIREANCLCHQRRLRNLSVPTNRSSKTGSSTQTILQTNSLRALSPGQSGATPWVAAIPAEQPEGLRAEILAGPRAARHDCGAFSQPFRLRRLFDRVPRAALRSALGWCCQAFSLKTGPVSSTGFLACRSTPQ
jgi:hypothetical protein